MGRQMVQIGEIEHQFGNACRFAIPTQGFLQAVGLGWNVVQKLAILEFSQKRRFPIDEFIESRISSRKSPFEWSTR